MHRATAAPLSHLTEPVIGYREWMLIGDELLSPLARTPWRAGPVRAECLDRCRSAGGLWRAPSVHEGPAPDPSCVCGIYALFAPPRRRARERLAVVRGAVVLSGRIELHRRGMRAELAEIAVLAMPPPSRSAAAVARTAEGLGVEAVTAGELGEAALAYGRPLEPSMIPS